MVRACVESEKFYIEGVREDGEGLPTPGRNFSKCGHDSSRRESLGYMRVVPNIFVVVVFEEFEAVHRGINCEAHGYQKQRATAMEAGEGSRG